MTALILQGRLDSSRLPGKSLCSLGGEALLFRVMEALDRVPCDLRILACPEDCEASFLPLARRAGFELVTGPKDDVLGRFCAAMRRFRPDRVIRATGDNPFVFADAAAALAGEAAALDADYAGYRGLPYGAGVEALKAAALFRAEQEAAEPFEREHVCPYLYKHPERFRVHRPFAPETWLDPLLAENRVTRLSVDTAEDLETADALYAALTEEYGGGDKRFFGENIIRAYLERFSHAKSS
ncbi:MAG: NTP transferase domain-containing protein, partial [Treponema sp.]|nr:NTP transferase domain-containing protein [Treponema sp.]